MASRDPVVHHVGPQEQVVNRPTTTVHGAPEQSEGEHGAQERAEEGSGSVHAIAIDRNDPESHHLVAQ